MSRILASSNGRLRLRYFLNRVKDRLSVKSWRNLLAGMEQMNLNAVTDTVTLYEIAMFANILARQWRLAPTLSYAEQQRNIIRRAYAVKSKAVFLLLELHPANIAVSPDPARPFFHILRLATDETRYTVGLHVPTIAVARRSRLSTTQPHSH